MLQAGPTSRDFLNAGDSEPVVLSRPDLAWLIAENVRLREENQALRTESIHERQQAHYYRSLHRGATERLEEREKQIEVLKAKVADLQHRLFGRKSERIEAEGIATAPAIPKRPRGQQPGTAGHGRTRREGLPVVEIELDPPADQILCAGCGGVWERWGEPEVSEQIEWEVRLYRRRTKRNIYRRPKGCTCENGRPEIVCAPAPASLISKGLLAISFIVEVLLLKYLYSTPLNRILSMVGSDGMALSAGTLCGVLEKITPLFVPLYEAIYARSREQDLALMDETRWAVFVEEEGKGSHRWWLWVVVTAQTRLYILSPSRSRAVPKDYFGHDAEGERVAFHKQVMVDRYKAYEFLKDLLLLAYCWAHVRRDFLEARSEARDCQWADEWVARIGELYQLNKARMALGCEQASQQALPAPQDSSKHGKALAGAHSLCKASANPHGQQRGRTRRAHGRRGQKELLRQRLEVERPVAGHAAKSVANPALAQGRSVRLSESLSSSLRQQRLAAAERSHRLAAVEFLRAGERAGKGRC